MLPNNRSSLTQSSAATQAGISQAMVAVALVFVGLALPQWPVCVLGLLLACLSGQVVVGMCIGLFLDILWGSPPGMLHALVLPWTLAAAILLSARVLLGSRMLVKMPKQI
jgi:hypothetical protein